MSGVLLIKKILTVELEINLLNSFRYRTFLLGLMQNIQTWDWK